MIIDVLRNKYPLLLLLKKFNISKSSYCYQRKVLLPSKHGKTEKKSLNYLMKIKEDMVIEEYMHY